MLLLADIIKTFRGRTGPVRALAGASLELGGGCLAVLAGASGSGKSTLLHIAAGLLRPDSGTVRVDGNDCSRLGEGGRAALRRRLIGIVFQRAHLLPYLDVLANASVGGGSTDVVRQGLGSIGLGDRLRHRPGELSTGERQRVALVRALAGAPRLVLADEPTANLDPDNARLVIGMLRAAAAGGAAVLVASHDPALHSAADRRLRMREGAVHEESR